MNTYGTPSGATILSRTPGTVSLQRARRALAAAKNARGWVRKAYLQSAVEHLSDVERKVLEHSPARSYLTGRVAPVAPQLVEGLIRTAIEFQSIATQDELESAVAQVARAYGLELDVEQAEDYYSDDHDEDRAARYNEL